MVVGREKKVNRWIEVVLQFQFISIHGQLLDV